MLKEYSSDDSLEILDTLINGKRLKDIRIDDYKL